MARLQRFTTEYIAAEDRIRITGENAEGAINSFWLTQRLATRLIQHLLKWLQEETAADSGKASAADERIQEFIQEAAQKKAVSQLKPEKPVRAKDDSASWLAKEVDLSKSPPMVAIRFKGFEGEVAELTMQFQQLRQWLVILHHLWQGAQWSVALWPDWFRVQKKKPGSSIDALH